MTLKNSAGTWRQKWTELSPECRKEQVTFTSWKLYFFPKWMIKKQLQTKQNEKNKTKQNIRCPICSAPGEHGVDFFPRFRPSASIGALDARDHSREESEIITHIKTCLRYCLPPLFSPGSVDYTGIKGVCVCVCAVVVCVFTLSHPYTHARTHTQRKTPLSG